jgi:hypothetical protein
VGNGVRVALPSHPPKQFAHQPLVGGGGGRGHGGILAGVTGGGTGELNSKPLNVWSGSLSWLHQLYSGEIAPSEASADGGTFLSG